MGFLDTNALLYFGQKVQNWISSAVAGRVPTSRKVANKPLTDDITLTASDVGLGDAATRIATLENAGYIPASQKGVAGGVAQLDGSGTVPSAQLPSYVDKIIEFPNRAAFPPTGSADKIYVAKDTMQKWRWSGTTYTEVPASLALGETAGSAYRGDRGKEAYDHSQLTAANPHNVTKTHVGLDNVTNVAQAKSVDVGNVNSLDTTSKTVVGAINEVKSSVGNITAITNAEIDALFPV